MPLKRTNWETLAGVPISSRWASQAFCAAVADFILDASCTFSGADFRRGSAVRSILISIANAWSRSSHCSSLRRCRSPSSPRSPVRSSSAPFSFISLIKPARKSLDPINQPRLRLENWLSLRSGSSYQLCKTRGRVDVLVVELPERIDDRFETSGPVIRIRFLIGRPVDLTLGAAPKFVVGESERVVGKGAVDFVNQTGSGRCSVHRMIRVGRAANSIGHLRHPIEKIIVKIFAGRGRGQTAKLTITISQQTHHILPGSSTKYILEPDRKKPNPKTTEQYQP